MKALAAFLLALPVFAQSLTVTVIYGNGKPDKTATTTYEEGSSALDALRSVSTVETSSTGPYLFVRSIDGTRSIIGRFGWFYLIDGQNVPVTAQNYRLKDAKTMTWIYKEEACY